MSPKPVLVAELFADLATTLERAKPLAPQVAADAIELATDAAIARGHRQGLAYVDSLQDEEGDSHVLRLLHDDHDWAGDARAEKYHLRAAVSDLDADTYYEAFDRAARGRAREIEGWIESLQEGAAERMGER